MIGGAAPTAATVHQPGVDRSAEELILATDVDGTLVGGSNADRHRLIWALSRRAETTRVILTTGRSLETARPLLSDALVPRPEYIIADIGATVVRAPDLTPVQPLQAKIEDRWPGTRAVREALDNIPGLTDQRVPQEHRCSFYFEGDAQQLEELRRLVEELGCDFLYSMDRFVDVIPRGVSKGTTLAALLDHIGADREATVVAGDTMNDWSMYEQRLKGIAVGNSEEALLERLRPLDHVYVAASEGAGGVLEGLIHHGFVTREDAEAAPLPTSPKATVSEGVELPLVVVYHRLPFEEYRRKGEQYRRPPSSPNGIIPSLLGLFAGGREGSWVAWSKQPDREPDGFEANVPVDEESYPNLTASRIPLTKDDIEIFYKRFSKEAFWPIIFSFPSKAEFREEHWERYLEVNRIFAERTAAEAPRGALIWIHDYNLWMVPAYLRIERPDLRIAFFHHTAFPPADVFNIVPWHREIVSSLLKCDYVGFHIPRYVENFADVVRSFAPATTLERQRCAPRFVTFGCALGVEQMTTALHVDGRTLRLGAHPVGIDVDRIRAILDDDEVRGKVESIRAELEGRACVLSVERLDYVKGPLAKIEAFEQLLERHPELHGKVVLINVVTPPAPGMTVYRPIRERVDQAIGRVNGRFGKLDWTPIRYFYRSLPFEDVIAYMAASDVAWITPLRDGLNLVAKEYVASHGILGEPGTLVISEFAGAAVELHGTLLTNPYDARQMEEDLHRALILDERDRRHRIQRMFDIVSEYDVKRWGDDFLKAATAAD